MKTRIVIVGGGFVGVMTALELVKHKRKDLHIRLISDRPNFEYHGALYRLVTGGSPLEVCMPLRDIFDGLEVDIVVDRVASIDHQQQSLAGVSESVYAYDYLVMGAGAETNYFGIPGLEESWGMKTISDALALKNHIVETLALCPSQELARRQQSLRFVIVGAGATGVELAGELAGYVKHLVLKHGLDPKLVSIDLVERSSRILPQLHESLAKRVTTRLEYLGVTIRCETSVESLEGDTVNLSGEQVVSPTVVWTAGVRAHALMSQLHTQQDRMGRVVVDEHLRPLGYENIFVGGDCAATPFAGMAQTAIGDGRFIADCIARDSARDSLPLKTYAPVDPIYSIPSGPGWAATQWGRVRMYGTLGWVTRRLADLSVFMSILPPGKAWGAFRAHYHSQHPVEVCE